MLTKKELAIMILSGDILGTTEQTHEAVKMAIEAILEQKTGKWIKDKYGAEYCSECGKHPYNDGEYYVSGWRSDFCPHCGAKMDGTDDE